MYRYLLEFSYRLCISADEKKKTGSSLVFDSILGLLRLATTIARRGKGRSVVIGRLRSIEPWHLADRNWSPDGRMEGLP